MDFKNVLIDFGYTGVMEIPTGSDIIKQFIDYKKSKNLVSTTIASTYAAIGMSKPTFVEKITLDSLTINGKQYYNIPAEFKEKVSIKLGLAFFSSTCKKVIINNNDKKIYLQLKNTYDFKTSFPVSVVMKSGKLKIAATSISDSLIANSFAIDEEINTINGKSGSDFSSECDFLNWYYLTRWNKLTIKKINGQEIEVRKNANP